MTPSRTDAWRVAAITLAFCLAGCSDFSQHRYGGVRLITDEVAEGPPAPPLRIPNPPSVAQTNPTPLDGAVQPAKFAPQPVGPNPQALKHPLRVLYERAAQRHANMDSYIFRLKRRETVAGKKQPEEVLEVKLRREPYSVYLKWLSAEGKGREVVYVRGKFDNKMQILMAPGDPFAMLLPRRMSIAPDDSMARAKSRYPITETGFGTLIERFGLMVAGIEKGDPREGTAKYLGRVKRPEFEAAVEAVHQVLPAGSDPQLLKGGERWWHFDAASGLPVLIVANDPGGEVEYYCYDHVQFPVRLDEDDFNPERLWRK